MQTTSERCDGDIVPGVVVVVVVVVAYYNSSSSLFNVRSLIESVFGCS